MSVSSARPRRAARSVLGLILLIAAAGWALLVHHGLGPRPDLLVHWWSPRGFLTRALLGSPFEWLLADRGAAFLVFWLPACALAAGIWAATRSSLARAAGASLAVATALFLLFGLGSDAAHLAWNLFRWRASAAMLASAAAIGCALTAPWLAASWLRLAWPARIAWLAPVTFAALAIERNVTGSNPRLPFAISPWPAVQVFGLDVVGTIAAALLAGAAVGAAGLARWRGGRAASGLLLAALGLALPAGWLLLGNRGLLPFHAGGRLFAAITALCAIGLAAAFLPRGEPARLARRARTLGAAAALLGAPILLGQAWSRFDYTRNRDVHAQRIIDALQAHYRRDTVYPETLEKLVEAGDLDAIPKPRVGFSFLSDATRFNYQQFGDTNYLLEFPAPRWVECAYSPPYEDEDADDEDGDDLQGGEEDDDLAGAWSCPSKPPELW